MLAEIRRKISELDPVIAPNLAVPQALRRNAQAVRGEPLGACKMQRLVVAKAEQDHRIDRRLALDRAAAQFGSQPLLQVPIAQLEGAIGKLAYGELMVRRDGDRPFVA